MEEVMRKILSGLSYTELKYIKEHPYLIDEIIYEKRMELINMQKEYYIRAVNNSNSNGLNWIDSQKLGR